MRQDSIIQHQMELSTALFMMLVQLLDIVIPSLLHVLTVVTS